MGFKQITVKDIALRLNLHHTTVSKALRNHPDISRETKELVSSTAKEMDYHPNSIAKNLRSRNSRTIGVIVPSIKNDFFSTAISGIEEAAYREGYHIIVCQSNENADREAAHVHNMISNWVAGLLISVSQTTRRPDHFAILEKRDIPLVFFDRTCENVPASRVVVDDVHGAFEAVQYLISTGRKNIAHFSGPEFVSVSRNRRKGYVDALIRHGLPLREDWIIPGGFQEEDGHRAFHALIERGPLPQAIFSVNDPVAFGAYAEIRGKGLRIPEDVALVGFGDNILSSYLDPPLTTVRQSPYEMGKSAAGIILDRIRNRPVVPGIREIVIKTQLIVRKSA
jgi:DNA-binding LacI/PurR family transcriptional regulator